MKTIYDLVSIALFAGLAILYLQRAASDQPDSTALWKYAVAAVSCAVADYLGNHGQALASILVFVALIVFAVIMLRPFSQGPST